MSILSILIIIIALLFIIFLISLSLGLTIFLKLIKDDDGFKADIKVKWIAITVFSWKFPYSAEEKKKREEKAKKKKIKEQKALEKKSKKSSEKKEKCNLEKWNDFKRLFPLITSNISPIFDFFLTCIHSVKLQKFDTHITLGLSSYSDTAMYTGYIWAFTSVSNFSNHFNLTADPSFTKEAIDFESEIIFTIKLLKPFLAMLKLLTKRSMLKLIWNLRVMI